MKRELITRGDAELYLHRFVVFKCSLFGIMFHRFYRSDDPCLHDHPWPFISVILRGGYWETLGVNWMQTVAGPAFTQTLKRWHSVGSVLFRRAGAAHKIDIDPSRPAITLVLAGPRKRMWGFFTRFGWLPFFRYSQVQHCA